MGWPGVGVCGIGAGDGLVLAPLCLRTAAAATGSAGAGTGACTLLGGAAAATHTVGVRTAVCAWLGGAAAATGSVGVGTAVCAMLGATTMGDGTAVCGLLGAFEQELAGLVRLLLALPRVVWVSGLRSALCLVSGLRSALGFGRSWGMHLAWYGCCYGFGRS